MPLSEMEVLHDYKIFRLAKQDFVSLPAQLSGVTQSGVSLLAKGRSVLSGSMQHASWGVGSPALIEEQALFFRAWLRQPITTGAIMPTRTPLAQAMARAAAANGDGPVIELGGGTDQITRALVDTLPAPRSLVVVERNPTFHHLLTRRFPSLRIVCGDAEDLFNIVGPNDMGEVRAIVSCLPRACWPLARQRRILDQCFSLLAADGVFLEFSYHPFSPVPGKLLKELNLVAHRLQRVWTNFPPAIVWGYRWVRTKCSSHAQKGPYRIGVDRSGEGKGTAVPLLGSTHARPLSPDSRSFCEHGIIAGNSFDSRRIDETVVRVVAANSTGAPRSTTRGIDPMRFASCVAASLIAMAGLINNAPAGLMKGPPIAEARPIRVAADIEMTVSNKYGYARLRQQPNEYSKLLATLPEGTKVAVIKRAANGSWVHIKVGDKEGYIQVNLLQ